jgi:thiamine monophosphate kinase
MKKTNVGQARPPRAAWPMAPPAVSSPHVLGAHPICCTTAQVWGDGEDHELLFALPAECGPALQGAWAQALLELVVTRIGCLTMQKDQGNLREGGSSSFG